MLSHKVPLPVRGLVPEIVIQLAVVDTVQLHPLPVVTVLASSADDALGECVRGETVKLQLPA
jgi:hypothetical protein